MSPRRVRLALASALLAVASSGMPLSAPSVLAAPPEVPISSTTTYTVDAERNVIQVAVDATLTSYVQDTASFTYYVNGASLILLPGATNLRATGPSGESLALSVVEQTEDYVLASIGLSANVYQNQSYRFLLVYDLPGVGDGAAPFTHADESFASFPVWAHSTPETAGNRVVVVIPAGYVVGVTFGNLPIPVLGASGETIYDFGLIGNADTFWAFFSAKRSAGLAKLEIEAQVGDDTVRVLLRGWADDPAWLEEVGPVVERGLGALADLIGLPYPGLDTLYVDETVSWLIAGYAGIYDASTGRIEVSELADEFVTLHETSHAWFNGAMLADRWSSEGFADYYASEAAAVLGIDISGWEPEEPATVEFALVDWPPLRRADDQAEPYGYQASQWAAYLIGERAGTEALAAVWGAIARHEVAYQPANATNPEASGRVGAADARELLDQLEERTSLRYDDIWLAWVLPADEAAAIAQRSAARETYADLVDHAGTWNLPRTLRRAMDDWSFAMAERDMRSAEAVLDEWEAVETAAEALDLDPTNAVEVAFESGEWAAAENRAAAESDSLDHLAAADGALGVEPDLLESVGLVGEDLAVEMAAAEEAYEAGELDEATAAADAVTAVRLAARDAGTQRVAIGGGVVVLGVGGSMAGLWYVRRRRVAARDSSAERGSSAEGEANGAAEPTPEVTASQSPGDASEP